MPKLLILDKETIVRPQSGGGSVQHPEDQELLPGVADVIAQYAVNDWMVTIVSGQGGVVAGHKSLDSAIAEMRFCLKQLIFPFLKWPQSLYFRGLLCPDGGETLWDVRAFCAQGDWLQGEISEQLFPGEYGYRAPDTGMLKEAEYYLKFSGIEISRILMVGDPQWRQAAISAGANFAWVEEWIDETPHD